VSCRFIYRLNREYLMGIDITLRVLRTCPLPEYLTAAPSPLKFHALYDTC
jgi:hypothetical protein